MVTSFNILRIHVSHCISTYISVYLPLIPKKQRKSETSFWLFHRTLLTNYKQRKKGLAHATWGLAHEAAVYIETTFCKGQRSLATQEHVFFAQPASPLPTWREEPNPTQHNTTTNNKNQNKNANTNTNRQQPATRRRRRSEVQAKLTERNIEHTCCLRFRGALRFSKSCTTDDINDIW